MSERETILESLARSAKESIRPDSEQRTDTGRDLDNLWREFETNLTALGGEMDSIALLANLGEATVWLDDDVRTFVCGAVNRIEDVWSAEIGIGTARLAVAETGSLLISTGPGKARMTSLAPPRHIAIVRRDAIVATLEEALAEIGSRTTVLVTGPSRTADIEGVLVRGVHGPRDLTVIVLRDPDAVEVVSPA